MNLFTIAREETWKTFRDPAFAIAIAAYLVGAAGGVYLANNFDRYKESIPKIFNAYK